MYRFIIYLYFCMALMVTFTGRSSGQTTQPKIETPQTQLELANDPILSQAVKMLENGQADQAYELLIQNMAGHEQDVAYRFSTGMAALNIGKSRDAIKQFKTILDINPDLPRVRLELARAYNATGKNIAAKSEFSRVLDVNLPPQVRDNVEQYMAAIGEQKQWRVHFSTSYIYDDNVNAGPSTDTVAFFGIPFALAPDAKSRSDSGISTNLTIDHLLPFSDEVALRSSLTFDSLTYFRYSEFNLEQFNLLVGPQFSDGQFVIGIPLVFNYSRLGSDRYGMAIGAAPRITYALTPRLALTASILAQAAENWQRPDRKGNLWSVKTSAKYLLNQKSFVELGYHHTRENTKVTFLDNDLDSIFMGFYTQLPSEVGFYIRPSIGWNRYDEKEAAFTTARDDLRISLDLNLSKEIGETDFFVNVGYTYTYNDSNLSLYEFNRNQVTVQISKDF